MNSPIKDVLSWSTSDKLALIDILWDSIAANPQDLPMSDELLAELDRRQAELDADPSTGITWGELKQRLGSRHE